MIDDVITLLMKKLDLQIPPFELARRLTVKRIPMGDVSEKEKKHASKEEETKDMSEKVKRDAIMVQF